MDASQLESAASVYFATNSPQLSSLIETRQTRQIGPKLLIPRSRCLSGRPENPTSNPTNRPQKPDKSIRGRSGEAKPH